MTLSELRPHEVVVETPSEGDASLWYIGRIHTPWADRSACPRSGNATDGPLCEIRLDPRWAEALSGIEAKDKLQILYWMHQSRRDLVLQNPRFDENVIGTFALRAPTRPNPIASSIITLERIEGSSLFVRGLDCMDGTPLLDIKPAICPVTWPEG